MFTYVEAVVVLELVKDLLVGKDPLRERVSGHVG